MAEGVERQNNGYGTRNGLSHSKGTPQEGTLVFLPCRCDLLMLEWLHPILFMWNPNEEKTSSSGHIL